MFEATVKIIGLGCVSSAQAAVVSCEFVYSPPLIPRFQLQLLSIIAVSQVEISVISNSIFPPRPLTTSPFWKLLRSVLMRRAYVPLRVCSMDSIEKLVCLQVDNLEESDLWVTGKVNILCSVSY